MSRVVEITKQLVEIPSFPRNNDLNGEEDVARFIEQYFKEYLPYFRAERQTVIGERYNLIMSSGLIETSELIFCCHMDTVQPSDEQMTSGRIAVKKADDKLIGCGACDMKGGTAALLAALSSLGREVSGVTIIFYCDEEDGFLGMHSLMAKTHLSSKLAIFPEPTDLEIANGCRGLIEIAGEVRGKRAHAARPRGGLNAILLAVQSFIKLEEIARQYQERYLGCSVCNLASIDGGLETHDDVGALVIKRSGNVIPDLAKVIVECRTTSKELDADKLVNLYSELVSRGKGQFTLQKINYNYGCMVTDTGLLVSMESALHNAGLPVSYMDSSEAGYYDAQMFAERFGIPCACFGPAPWRTSHQKDEYVTIESLEKTTNVFQAILGNF